MKHHVGSDLFSEDLVSKITAGSPKTAKIFNLFAEDDPTSS